MSEPTARHDPAADHDGIPSIDLSDEDILDAMQHVPGYLDITTGDFREVYELAHRHAAGHLSHEGFACAVGALLDKAAAGLRPEE